MLGGARRARRRPPDGQFFYGVRTTGVYCRPGCASRQPLRKNTAVLRDEGGGGGRRAPALQALPPDRGSLGLAAYRGGREGLRADARAATPCRASPNSPRRPAISRFHFHRVFKQITGATPRDYARAHRLGRFADKLDAGEPVTEAIYASGFGSSSRAYEAAPAALGMTPGRGGAAARARRSALYGRDRARLGAGRGDRARHLHDRARRRSRRAWRPRCGNASRPPRSWPTTPSSRTGPNGSCGSSPRPIANLDLPLDIRGTAFQARVWRALQKIPLGRTATYTEIAAALGQPKAVRAVAAACAANKLALLVPCHRVIRSDGDLAGYRWGLERKRALLARERAAAERERTDEAAA